MTSRGRLAEEGTQFERELLASARADAGSVGGLERTLAAMSLGAAAAGYGAVSAAGSRPEATARAGGAAGDAMIRLSGAGLGIVVKWVGLAVTLAGIVTGGWMAYVDHRPRAPVATFSPTAVIEPPEAQKNAAAPAIEAPSPQAPVAVGSIIVRTAPERRTVKRHATAAPAAAAEDARSSEPSPASSPSTSSLDAEVAALEQVQALLDGHDGAGALDKLDDYARTFPAPALADEAAVLRVDALVEQGDYAAAAALSERFLAANPSSAHAPHLRQIVRSATQNAIVSPRPRNPDGQDGR